MARELGEVLHYFIDEPADRRPPAAAPARPAQTVVGVPVGPGDVVRPALLWNLAIELARAGRRATVVTPADPEEVLPWVGPGPAALGARWAPTPATDLAELCAAAGQQARIEAKTSRRGVVLTRVPSAWIDADSRAHEPLRWILLFTRSVPREVERTWDLIRRLLGRAPDTRVGVTLHGVSYLDEARGAFFELAGRFEQVFGRPLWSYGLLVDDLDVYRAIVERRAIGVARPQSRAARALSDVARLLMEDVDAAHV